MELDCLSRWKTCFLICLLILDGMLRGRHFRQAFCSRRHFRQLTHKQFRQLIIRGIGKLKDKTPKFLKIKITKPIQQVHFTIYTSMPKRCTPKRCIPEKCTLKRCTPERYTPKRYTPKKYTPRKCTPRRCTPRRCISRRYTPGECTPGMHAWEMHGRERKSRQVRVQE